MAEEGYNPYLPRQASFSKYMEVYEKQQSRTASKKLEFIENFKSYDGNVRQSSLSTGIQPKTYYNWCKADPLFAQAAQMALDEQRDDMNDVLMRAIRNGNARAAMFYLSHRHPDYMRKRQTTPPRKVLTLEEMYTRAVRKEAEMEKKKNPEGGSV